MKNRTSNNQPASTEAVAVAQNTVLHVSQYFSRHPYLAAFYVLGAIALIITATTVANHAAASVTRSITNASDASLQTLAAQTTSEAAGLLGEPTDKQAGGTTKHHDTTVSLESKTENGHTTSSLSIEHNDGEDEGDGTGTESTHVFPATNGQTIVSVSNDRGTDGNTTTQTHNTLMMNSSSRTTNQNNTTHTTSSTSTHLMSSTLSHSTSN